MSKLLMARTLVLDNDLQKGSLGRQMTGELDWNPRGESRYTRIRDVEVEVEVEFFDDSKSDETRIRLA